MMDMRPWVLLRITLLLIKRGIKLLYDDEELCWKMKIEKKITLFPKISKNCLDKVLSMQENII